MSKKYVFLFLAAFFAAAGIYGDDFPDWYISLRDALYGQVLSSQDILGLYNIAQEQAKKDLTGADLSIMLSRSEYIMGRALMYENKKSDADPYFVRGMDYAQKSLDLKPSAEGWQMLAENISQLCTIRPVPWVMANGLKVEQYSKNALKLDPGNTDAQYMIAARYVYAPAPFHDYNKGIKMMQDILNNYDNRLQKDDRFNVYSAIGYTFIQQKKKSDARPWLQKALEVYPTNKFVGNLLAGL